MSAEWRPLSEAPVDRECVVCNIFTGVMAISSHDDKPDRRGWNHRNGFNATHFLSGIPDLPTLPEDHEALHLEADARGMTVSDLASKILAAVIDDDLFAAILDR